MAKNSINDARIHAIMDQLNKKEASVEAQGEPAPREKTPAPPTTFNEFVAAEKLDEWPQRLTSENPLDLSKERDFLGNKDRIEDELKKATPIDLKVLKDLEVRLNSYDSVLHKYAYMILKNKDEEEEKEQGAPLAITDGIEKGKLPAAVNRAFLTEMAESDAVKAHPSRKRKVKSTVIEQKENLKDSIAESRKKKVDHCVFPGFRRGELTELPTQIEAPHILHRITKAQDFNRGFRKFWKKIFLSEASVAVMQDTFWWMFLDKFASEKNEAAKSQLFDRIADSFVALFYSVNPEIKDKVFHVYSDCLCQAIFAAYFEAFPESLRIFTDDFKQYICNLVHLWVAGVTPPLNAHKHWNPARMMPKTMRSNENNKAKVTHDITVGNDNPANHKLDMDDFHRVVDTLGQEPPASTRYQGLPGFSREVTKMTTLTGAFSKLSMAAATPVGQGHTAAPSRLANTVAPPKKAVRESHVIGPGPELERVKFNLKGRSPLVAHYLAMRQLKDAGARGQNMHRTQIAKLPPSDLPTYRQLIDETLKVQDALSKEYQKVCEATSQEILKIEKQQIEANRKIARLKARLMQCRNSMEVKILSERIRDQSDLDESRILRADDADASVDRSGTSHR